MATNVRLVAAVDEGIDKDSGLMKSRSEILRIASVVLQKKDIDAAIRHAKGLIEKLKRTNVSKVADVLKASNTAAKVARGGTRRKGRKGKRATRRH
jgi:hypothetical protein